MDGVTLLNQAKAAGLRVRAVGDKIVINGPKRLEPLALKLLANKPMVMNALTKPIGSTDPTPETSDDAASDLIDDPIVGGWWHPSVPPDLRRALIEAAEDQEWARQRRLNPPKGDPPDVPEGWQPRCWVERLRYLAAICIHPQRSQELWEWAHAVERWYGPARS